MRENCVGPNGRKAGVWRTEPFWSNETQEEHSGRGRKPPVVVDSGAAENVMPRTMVPDISTEETERAKNGKGFNGSGGVHIKNYGQQVMSVRTPQGVVRKSTWQVADVRRPLVSASHIIGKTEAYIMNKKKKKLVLKKRRHRVCA